MQRASSSEGARAAATHEVTNQAPAYSANVYTTDPLVVAATERAMGAGDGKEAGDDHIAGGTSVVSKDALIEAGHYYGHEANYALAAMANENGPVLAAYDAVGNRINAVDFHPAWHDVMEAGTVHGVGHGVWADESVRGRYTARGAMLYMHSQWEHGSTCPLVMTNAAFPLLKSVATTSDERVSNGCRALALTWANRIRGGVYDGRDVPANQKPGVTLGMSMTEKQGGSDVRANTTLATPVSGSAAARMGLTAEEAAAAPHTLVGHKWFTSAPMSDAFITLAYTDEGMSAFLVPRWLESGERNAGFQVMRLKNKLGDRSNASSEVEYRDAVGFLMGAPGRGIATLLEMVHHTRLDCVTGSAGSMRMGLARAAHHAAHRSVFGTTISDSPLGANVLADLALESHAATLMAFELMAAFEGAAEGDAEAAAYARVATAMSKFFVCKRLPGFAAEAMEVFGGNGYVDDAANGMPRLFRQSPLNAIWEGSGSVMVLDIMRAAAKEPAAMAAFLGKLETELAADSRAASFLAASPAVNALKTGSMDLVQGRAAVHSLALALQAMLMMQRADGDVADAFIASRLTSSAASGVGLYGGLDLPLDQIQRIVDGITTE
ncbi:acyl-CoA dehydrogenase domain-containing protein [Thecamonas trahens ATCC 50062]|uniref:Acyl-CoA dehydrogenase domain-containing protein n=1 Tax=Thecamonas trahens ATCC 50062 TaxID=461836 RepID=A0A0L0DUB1_THETB|nr:acyl-CoA dehydrogenase domain-containing protein [Thecamonas trahens ATCC 50062]KNC55860.1 acyl-CoA dehydrogenase domain-containing protein [Thecamonas trahens ATCC 50062]|eukprot:XP_013752785.1 acyl-CoA dehydrogenase domain-containing protein [Thecamonas trahens ATCC 50062]